MRDRGVQRVNNLGEAGIKKRTESGVGGRGGGGGDLWNFRKVGKECWECKVMW